MRKYIRFIDGFRRFHKVRMQPEEAAAKARTFIKKRVAAREENFLNLVERGIFNYPRSPYRTISAIGSASSGLRADLRSGMTRVSCWRWTYSDRLPASPSFT